MIVKRLSSLRFVLSLVVLLLSGLSLPAFAEDGDSGETYDLVVSMLTRIRGTTYKQQLYALSADGSRRVRLTETSEDEKSPTVSPDGKKIAFVSHRDGKDQIYVMNADGSNPINVDGDPNAYYDSPVWSPDGARLLFHSYTYHAEAGTSYGEIWVVDADGANKRLLRGSPEASIFEASWSPNGRELVYREETPEGRTIGVMTDSASDSMRLTDPGRGCYNPTWSPAGGQIAFVCAYGEAGVWTAGTDGTNAVKLVADVNAGSLIWSPDSQLLAYLASPTGLKQLYTVDFDSAVVETVDPTRQMADLDFAWSPDGTRIAAVVNGESPNLGQLVIIDLAAQTRAVIVSDLYVNGRPSWIPQPRARTGNERPA